MFAWQVYVPATNHSSKCWICSLILLFAFIKWNFKFFILLRVVKTRVGPSLISISFAFWLLLQLWEIVWNQNFLFCSYVTVFVFSTGLEPGEQYYYKCGDPSIPAMSAVHAFKTMPISSPQSYPNRIAIVGDLGLTYNTTSTIDHMSSNEPDLIVLVGDVTYANLYLTNGTGSDCYSCSFPQTLIHETYQPRWDYWGRWVWIPFTYL